MINEDASRTKYRACPWYALGGTLFFFWHTKNSSTPVPPGSDIATLPIYTTITLAQYNGTVADLPIYVALDGYIYDVSAGRTFYAPGGTYHSIAGKDASQELHLFGGDIIHQKYPIVGKLSQKQ